MLMTDVVMPEMNGRDLAKSLLSLYPNMRRLFMSGLTANVIAHLGLDGIRIFLKKLVKLKGEPILPSLIHHWYNERRWNMAHLKKEDSTLIGLIQAGSGDGDDTMRALVRHTIQQVLEDALYEKVRHNGAIVSRGVLTVIGIDADGYREVLGVWCADTESEASWSQVFGELKERGLDGVGYVVLDNHRGLVDVIHRHFQ